MAKPAFHRPDMPRPQPVEQMKVRGAPGAASAAPILPAPSEIPDRIFEIAMLACGLAVLGLLVLIVFELVTRSALSWHASGFKFFSGSDWDPVNEQVGALPLVYGTLVSALLALLIAVPLPIGVAGRLTRPEPDL